MSSSRPRWRWLCASASLASLACAASGQASAQTLGDAVAEAFSDNPDLEQARFDERAAREGQTQARAAYKPNLSVSGNFGAGELEQYQPTGLFGPTHSDVYLDPSTASAVLQQQLYTGGQRGGRLDLARASAATARISLRSTEQDVLLAAVQAYLSVWRDQQIVDSSGAYVQSLERELAGTQRRLEVGEVTRTDLAQAQARLAGARAAYASARSSLEGSRADFARAVGAEPDGLAPPPPAPAIPASLEAALQQAQDHPRVEAARANEDAAEARIRIERAALRPQMSFVARTDHYEDLQFRHDYRDNSSASIQLSVPLYEGGFAASRTRQARLNLDSARAAAESRRRETEADVVSRWNAALATADMLSAAEEQVVAAETAYHGAQREQGLGLRSTIEVLNAEQEWRQAEIDLARAQMNAQLSRYQLLSAVGGLTMSLFSSDAQ